LDSIRLRSSSPQTRRKASQRLTAAGKLPSPLMTGTLLDSLGEPFSRLTSNSQ
jgi:hypothetical protein